MLINGVEYTGFPFIESSGRLSDKVETPKNNIKDMKLNELLQRLECPDNVSSCKLLKKYDNSCVECANKAAREAATAIRTLLSLCNEKIDGKITNDPLTLEELRNMDGEAVWLRDGRRFLIDCDTDTACEKHGLNTSLDVLADIGMYRHKPDPWPVKNERGVVVEY